MGWNYETECEKCSAKVKVVEQQMPFPGGKETEQAYCPKCGVLIAEHRVNGFLNASLIDEKK